MEASIAMSHVTTDVPPSQDGYQDVLGSSFEASYNTVGDVWSEEPAMREVLPLLLGRLRPGSHVLDVGAGRGRDTLQMLQAGHRVDALDLVATSDWAALTARWPERLAFIQGELLTVQLERRYDAVLDNGCLHHQHPDAYEAYLHKLWQCTQPAAVLVVSFFTPSGAAAAGTLWVQHDGRLTRDFTEAEARALLQSTGWEVEQVAVVPRQSGAHHYQVVVARRTGE